MKKKTILLFVLSFCSLLASGEVIPGWEECGYYDDDPDSATVVNQFLFYYSEELFELTLRTDWTSGNNETPYGVDTYDLVYYCGQGFPYNINMFSAAVIDLARAGETPAQGYGGRDLEFLVLHASSVVPGTIDPVPDAYKPWMLEPFDIFDGLHVLLGFRTCTLSTSANSIASNFGYMTYFQQAGIIDAWINAVLIGGDHLLGCDKFSIMYTATVPGDPAFDASFDIYGQRHSADSDPSDEGFLINICMH